MSALAVAPVSPPPVGLETLVDARACDPAKLRDEKRLEALFAEVVSALGLHAVAPLMLHVFPGEGGVTAMLLLAESHLTAHTYPEHASLALNLYACSPRARFPWETRVRALFGAGHVDVRAIERGGR